MLRILREISKGCLARNVNVTSCTREDSKQCDQMHMWRSAAAFNNHILRNVYSHFKRKAHKISPLPFHSAIEAFGWGSVCTFGLLYALPFAKDHSRKIGEAFNNGVAPKCCHSPNLQMCKTFCMPLAANKASECAIQPHDHDPNPNEHQTSRTTDSLTRSKTCLDLPSRQSAGLDHFCDMTISRTKSVSSLDKLAKQPEQAMEELLDQLLQHKMDMKCSSLENEFGIQAAGDDPKAAFRAFRLSSAKLNKNGLFNLGVCYENGVGTSANIAKAVECYEKAALLGHPSAMHNLAVLDMAATDVNTQRRGMQRMHAAAQLGVAQAQSYMATVHAQADQWDKAVVMLAASAAQNDAVSMYNLGMCHEDGLGVPCNMYKAYDMYLQAANHNCHQAFYKVGLFNELGLAGLQASIDTAVAWYEKGAQKGHQMAIERLHRHHQQESAASAKDNATFLTSIVDYLKGPKALNDALIF